MATLDAGLEFDKFERQFQQACSRANFLCWILSQSLGHVVLTDKYIEHLFIQNGHSLYAALFAPPEPVTSVTGEMLATVALTASDRSMSKLIRCSLAAPNFPNQVKALHVPF